MLDWRHDWFVATDKRLLLFYGFITQKVAMMPLIKVTDMSYDRSMLGRILGYGNFVLESAGQDQALRTSTGCPTPTPLPRHLRRDLRGRGPRPGPDQR